MANEYKEREGIDGGIADMNLLYCNANPNPSTICNACKNLIGQVFIRGTQPDLPQHDGCFCYYELTKRDPIGWDPVDPTWPRFTP